MLQKSLYMLLIALLLGLTVGIFAIPLNHYSWADPPILDCDTDAEGFVELSIYLVWLTSAALAAHSRLHRRERAVGLASLALALAVGTSIGGGFRYMELLQHNQVVAAECRE